MITYLGVGTVKRIHVNRQVLARNKKLGQDAPAITVQTSKGPVVGRRAKIHGDSVMEQAGGSIKPLKCGAKVWLKTYATVEVIT